jgi:hypothetical protein
VTTEILRSLFGVFAQQYRPGGGSLAAAAGYGIVVIDTRVLTDVELCARCLHALVGSSQCTSFRMGCLIQVGFCRAVKLLAL